MMREHLMEILSKLHDQQFAGFCVDNKVKVALLFGSAARGTMRADSDLDLAVLLEKQHFPLQNPAAGRMKKRLLRDLSALLETSRIDLVILNLASSLLRHQVARTGRVLYEQSPGDFAQFASLALRQHNDARLFYQLEAEYLARRYKS